MQVHRFSFVQDQGQEWLTYFAMQENLCVWLIMMSRRREPFEKFSDIGSSCADIFKPARAATNLSAAPSFLIGVELSAWERLHRIRFSNTGGGLLVRRCDTLKRIEKLALLRRQVSILGTLVYIISDKTGKLLEVVAYIYIYIYIQSRRWFEF